MTLPINPQKIDAKLKTPKGVNPPKGKRRDDVADPKGFKK